MTRMVPSKTLSLEQFLASQTVLSRRSILDLIRKKAISIDGNCVHSLKASVMPKQSVVCVEGKRVVWSFPFVYYRFYKPKGVLTTLSDPKDRPALKACISGIPEPVFPVGRLDKNTSGLLLLTNDGHFSNRIAHPSYSISKVYDVTVSNPLSKNDLRRLSLGLFLDDGPVQFDVLDCLDRTRLTVSLSEGRNRIVRRAFDCLGYEVRKLKRLSIGPFQLGNLKEGRFKRISKKELLGFYDSPSF